MKLEVFEADLHSKKKETDNTCGTAEQKIKDLEKKFMDYDTERQIAKQK